MYRQANFSFPVYTFFTCILILNSWSLTMQSCQQLLITHVFISQLRICKTRHNVESLNLRYEKTIKSWISSYSPIQEEFENLCISCEEKRYKKNFKHHWIHGKHDGANCNSVHHFICKLQNFCKRL